MKTFKNSVCTPIVLMKQWGCNHLFIFHLTCAWRRIWMWLALTSKKMMLFALTCGGYVMIQRNGSSLRNSALKDLTTPTKCIWPQVVKREILIAFHHSWEDRESVLERILLSKFQKWPFQSFGQILNSVLQTRLTLLRINFLATILFAWESLKLI